MGAWASTDVLARSERRPQVKRAFGPYSPLRPIPNSLPTRTTFPPFICTSISFELPKGLPFSSFSVATCF